MRKDIFSFFDTSPVDKYVIESIPPKKTLVGYVTLPFILNVTYFIFQGEFKNEER